MSPGSHVFPAPVVLTSTQEVAALCERLRKEPFVTVDTEFVRERTYWPELCLVQLAGAEEVGLIDVCAPDLDLAPLGALLDEAECVKVFHAARQDLEIFLHLFDRLPVNVFDTQIAAMVAGYGDQIGYDSLVRAITGQTIDKAHRFSDWSARPLTKAQIAYASSDVTYLRLVYRVLRDQLQTQDRLHWADAEQAVLTDEATFRPDPRRLWEKLKPRTANRRLLGILREIVAWREHEAQHANVPRQRVIRDESLLEVAAVRPKTVEALLRVRGVSRGFAEGRMGAGLLEAVLAGERVPDADLPPVASKKNEQARPSQALVALLRVLLAAKSEECKVAARLVASAEDLERLALGEDEIAVLRGWRREVFGREAKALLEGSVVLSVEKGRVHIHPVQERQRT